MMFFDTLWQGIIFGVFTTVATLACMYKLTDMWKPFEEKKRVTIEDHCHH